MSLESSSRLPDEFQIRHCTLGIYQGTAIELGFWHPSSGMPYGLCRFATKEEADSYVAYRSSSGYPEPLDRNGLTVELYALTEHERRTNVHPLPSAGENPV